ncbi:MAG: hypothetical protein ACFFBC_13400 [Promethearchaeota archaeon]
MTLGINSRKLLLIFLLSISLLFLAQNGQSVSSSNSENSFSIDTEFQMTEYSIAAGTYSNTNTIDLELPSPTWEIDDIELNFTDVEFGIEVKVIEDNPTDNFVIEKFGSKYGYGVQIIIEDPTVIYGVFLYGNNESSLNVPIYIQINGFNNISNSPNATVYGEPILLNMSYSLSPSWHMQTFTEPIPLSPGNYFLIINGSAIKLSPKPKYNWYCNNVDPYYPELNISEYDGVSWTSGLQGTPFLHKLIQKVNYTFFPEEINMTAELDGNSFGIANGDHPGKGYLKKSNINYRPNKKDVSIKIKNNKTQSLDFNLNYSFNINNEFLAPSLLEIIYNSSNNWLIHPTIDWVSDEHSVRFEYPNNWYDISIFKNQQNITADVIVDSQNNMIIFPNEVIENGAEWEIQAYSPSVNFELNILQTEFTGGQIMQFSIDTPILNGIYHFILIDPLGIEKYQEIVMLPTENNIFSYEIPSNITEGEYIAYIYWHNQTDAGVQSQVFFLSPASTSSTSLDFPIFFIIGIVLIGGTVIGGSSYKTIKKVQTKHNDKLRLIYEQCNDIMNLEYIIVLDKKSGIDVYSESFGGKEVDATLISGFLQAIQNFGSEVLGRAKDSRTFKVEYRKSIILMAEFVNLRLIVILKESPSRNFLYAIELLAYDIYKEYGKMFDKFDGILEEFQGIRKLLDQHLNISFLYPLSINYTLKMKLNQAEKEMVQKAKKILYENNFDYFYAHDLLPENACSPKDYQTVLQLIQKRIFNPIDDSSN